MSLVASTSYVRGDGTLSTYREYEPVVIEGSQLGGWVDSVDLTKLNLFRYESGGTWKSIPYQIDKRRKIYLKKNMNDPTELGGNTDICEYGYFRELGVAAGASDDTFASNNLKSTDEVVFMLKDAGPTQAPTSAWLSGDVSTTRLEIILEDPRTSARRFVYVFNFTNGIPSSGTNGRSTDRYVSYTQDNPIPSDCALSPCPGCTRLYPCGTVEGVSTHLGGLETHSVHFLKNWVTDTYRIKSGPNLFADILTRFDFNVPGETEDSWSTNGVPRTLGVSSTAGSTENLVRVVRCVQGAQSGRHTTKCEFVYATKFVTRTNVRVHALSEIIAKVNHDSELRAESTGNPAHLWTQASFQSPGAPKDVIDAPVGTAPDELIAESYPDWTEVSSPLRGRYIHFFREVRPLPTPSAYYIYLDRLQPLAFGRYGRRWAGVGITQDGATIPQAPGEEPVAINDGGCGPVNDPESPALNFARFEYWMFPRLKSSNPTDPEGVLADNLVDNDLEPVNFAVRAQAINSSDPPVPMCTPGLTAAGNNNGATNLTINETNCDASLKYRLYRGTGSSSPLYFLRDVGSGSGLTDIAVSVGGVYRYAVSAYDRQNNEGSRSAPASITVSDTTAPAVPIAISAISGNGTATGKWAQNTTRDIQGYDIHLSSGGGTYVKQNGSPYPASGNRQWALAGLTNGVQYCFKIAAVDHSGNTSGLSNEVCATPSQ